MLVCGDPAIPRWNAESQCRGPAGSLHALNVSLQAKVALEKVLLIAKCRFRAFTTWSAELRRLSLVTKASPALFVRVTELPGGAPILDVATACAKLVRFLSPGGDPSGPVVRGQGMCLVCAPCGAPGKHVPRTGAPRPSWRVQRE